MVSRLAQNQCGADQFFELVESLLSCICPLELFVLLCQVIEWSCDSREILDETAIKVEEAHELLDFFQFPRDWPVFDSGCFDWVYRKCVVADDHSKVFYCRFLELTFLWFQVQIIPLQDFEDFSSDLLVFFNIVREDYDVVHVDKYFSLHD